MRGSFIAVRSAARVLPLLLVPFLVPRGSPSDTARAMGAGAAITGYFSESEHGATSPSPDDEVVMDVLPTAHFAAGTAGAETAVRTGELGSREEHRWLSG